MYIRILKWTLASISLIFKAFINIELSELISRESCFRRLNHVEKQISHTSDPFEQGVVVVASVHLSLGYKFVCSIEEETGKGSGLV